MLEQIKAYKIICDCCGKQYQTINGFVCYLDDDDGSLIYADAKGDGWVHTTSKEFVDGFENVYHRHYCDKCYKHDKDNNIVTNDGHTYDGKTHNEIS